MNGRKLAPISPKATSTTDQLLTFGTIAPLQSLGDMDSQDHLFGQQRRNVDRG
jgi:hypothetical protein